MDGSDGDLVWFSSDWLNSLCCLIGLFESGQVETSLLLAPFRLLNVPMYLSRYMVNTQLMDSLHSLSPLSPNGTKDVPKTSAPFLDLNILMAPLYMKPHESLLP